MEFEQERSPVASSLEPAFKYEFEVWVGTALLSGVVASAAFLTVGLAWRWIATGNPQFDYVLPRTNVLEFAREEILSSLRAGIRPRLLLNCGLVVLLFTPYVRVLLSFFYFVFFERNYKYGVFTGIVLAVLTYSLLLR